MGEAFDRDGQRLAEAFGATKREVFDKLVNLVPDAHEFRIRTVEEKMDGYASFSPAKAFEEGYTRI